MKGIILAGGTGSRLFPATLVCSKQLLPIYDKPMIYYPLSILMLAGIKDILIISTKRDLQAFESLLHDGSQLGISISYKVQDSPRGVAEAFIIAEDFIGDSNVCLVLGDNIFYGNQLSSMLQKSASLKEGCELYAISVANPESFGVAYEKDGKVIRIEEKPKNPTSNLAVTGLYFYDNNVVKLAKQTKLSERGELEITSINNEYVKLNKCKLNKLGRGIAWLDTGTHENMLKASMFIESVQNMTGSYIACIEEIAYRMGYIDKAKVLQAAEKCKNSDYGKFLKDICNEKNKVLLIGSEGQLGKEFQEVFKTGKTFLGQIPQTFKNITLVCVDRYNFDVTDSLQVEEKLQEGFDFVINCSAYTAVDKAEEEVEKCRLLNAKSVMTLAKLCKKYDTTLVHFSTDYVYGGEKNTPYIETDACFPETVYGKTKREGELNIVNNCDKYFIFRTAWLYGVHGKNFVYKMLELAKTHPKLTVVNDQLGTPTYANDLVYTVLQTLQTQSYGIFNCSGEGVCSWYDFAKEIFACAYVDVEVEPVDSSQYITPAKRPKYSVMENAKLNKLQLNFMRDWRLALKDFFTELNSIKGESEQ